MVKQDYSQELLEKYQKELDAARLQTDAANLSMSQQDWRQQEEKSIVKEQLDLSEEISRIDYLIKGYSLEPAEDGGLQWVAPTNKEMIIFSEYGIHLIRNTVCWYLNKNLLLSNFDEETIRKKMFDFTNDLIDTIFMEYDKVFISPSVEDCIEVLKERIKRQAQVREFAMELKGIEVDRDVLIKEGFDKLENKIEEEIEKIRKDIIKSKLKRYFLIVRTIQDAIHATYMRAWKGIERGTLRQHTQITETRGLGQDINKNSSGGLFSWRR